MIEFYNQKNKSTMEADKSEVKKRDMAYILNKTTQSTFKKQKSLSNSIDYMTRRMKATSTNNKVSLAQLIKFPAGTSKSDLIKKYPGWTSLSKLGFSFDTCIVALKLHDGNMKLAAKWLLSLNDEDVQKLLNVEANNIMMDRGYLERRQRLLEEKQQQQENNHNNMNEEENKRDDNKNMYNNKKKMEKTSKKSKWSSWLCKKRTKRKANATLEKKDTTTTNNNNEKDNEDDQKEKNNEGATVKKNEIKEKIDEIDDEEEVKPLVDETNVEEDGGIFDIDTFNINNKTPYEDLFYKPLHTYLESFFKSKLNEKLFLISEND